MIYSDIEDLIFCPDACKLVRDGVFYTEPFFATVDGALADAFLFYAESDGDPVAYGGVLVDPEKATVVKSVDDVELTLSSMLDKKSDLQEYQSLYEQLHGYIFRDELTDDMRKTVKEYLSFVKKDEYKYLYDVYTKLFPDVIEWLEKNS